MAEQFAVDTDGVNKASSPLDGLRENLTNVRNMVEEQLHQQGECWGTDAIGKGFASQYVKPKDDALAAMRELNKVVRSIQEGLETMSKGFEHGEDLAIDAISTLPGSIDAGSPAPGPTRRA